MLYVWGVAEPFESHHLGGKPLWVTREQWGLSDVVQTQVQHYNSLHAYRGGQTKQNVAPSHQHTRGQYQRVTTRHVGELTITDIWGPWYKVSTDFMFCDSIMGVLWWGVTTHYRQWVKWPIAALHYTRLHCGVAQLAELHTWFIVWQSIDKPPCICRSSVEESDNWYHLFSKHQICSWATTASVKANIQIMQATVIMGCVYCTGMDLDYSSQCMARSKRH